jgi:succinate dehydrogenase/fumarate reductase flavoprotein subunit
MYSYVVASDTPLYPSFGERNHYFETVNQALQVMIEWHKEAMAYQPTPEDLAEADEFAREMWETIKDKVTIVDVSSEPFTLPERFRDKSNGE